MVKYGSSLSFCTNAVERELYKFMCTTKKECGSIRVKAEWLHIIPVTDWESVFHHSLHSNPSFIEFWDELWKVGCEIRSFPVFKGRKPKLDKRWIARLYVLLWRVMEADKEWKAFDVACGEEEEPVASELVEMEGYLNPIVECVRREVEMSGL